MGKKAWIGVLVAAAIAFGGGAVGALNGQKAQAAVSAANYGLYLDSAAAAANGGYTFSQVTATDAVIKCIDGDGDGSTADANRKVASNGANGKYFAVTNDRSTFYEQYPGGVQRGGEWLLGQDNPIFDSTEGYESVSFDIGYFATYKTPAAGDSDYDSVTEAIAAFQSKQAESVIYVKGTAKNGGGGAGKEPESALCRQRVPDGYPFSRGFCLGGTGRRLCHVGDARRGRGCAQRRFFRKGRH